MNILKHPAGLVIVGILVGYALTRVLDQVPLVNRIPKVRIG
jgi:hypothetical protein